MTDAEPRFLTFPAYIMENMFEAGDNRQHLVETVISRIWAYPGCTHVFELTFIDQTGTWEAVWIGRPTEHWDLWLRAIDTALDEVIQATIAEIQDLTASEEGDDDGRSD